MAVVYGRHAFQFEQTAGAVVKRICGSFGRTKKAVGAYTLRDCDLNCDGVVNVADRSIANAIWRGLSGVVFDFLSIL